MLKKSSFDFLNGLFINNNKKWVDEHRLDYDQTLEDYTTFNQNLIDAISKFDQSIAKSVLQAKDCIPRLNRDLRFTKDKSPYKTYLYSIINEGGRKSGKAGYFIVMSPGECYIGAGAFQPEPDRLKKIRQKIDINFNDWKKITEDTKLLKAFPEGIVAQESLQKIPKGFDPDSPAEDFLKMKGFFVRNFHPDTFFRGKDNFSDIIESFKACQHLNQFVNDI
ncbi:DUF2461 domain-containing protein [Chryseobacterium sp. Ch-15]|uniref:DUF2461 domain-containing protein n=1 Tax=Chryseobacterium muglaense TaxID=2893752 RepID=A0A9Q3UY99_9FLAO|nr:DUF2461 domain-containing protein [Chryseobacterium muglaense]MBD3903332.1 DUF2461 domain-containing protein [Chryseobacterium muglaense]MCC9036161.1 DUF2461 domain-containing protein [Chryseobacterium muglaense]MCM2553264.1 DUF2461 domain-containing protein [Chryseobacterium muglaense]